MLDELELVGRLKDVEPLRPEAFEHARAALREAMAAGGPGPVAELDRARDRGPRRRILSTRGRAGVGIGIGVAAAAAAALVISGLQPAGTSARPHAASAAAHEGNARLLTLAAAIKASDGPAPGNATLVVRTQTNGSNPPEVGYDLYTDSGDYYWAPEESGLPQAIADHENLADGADAREVAAALYAVNGNLTTARARMVNATPNPFGFDGNHNHNQGQETKQKSAAVNATPRPVPLNGSTSAAPPSGVQRQDDISNYLWNNCVDALTEGAGNPQVRVGVLRLLATVPQVMVRSSAIGGQPVLTLTAGTALFAGVVQQVLTINAVTGMPVSSVSGVPGQAPSSVVTFQVSRVTLASIAAGKF
jgi:hypothetical protein